ncbi:MAG: ABC transporter [Desulfobacterales bacterium CG23_combo_of_CG06-09_8_20_14_all_51_8]|nr:MAG: ABC transporter [Desulfobacterales bacterium CG23_combo_of_CG06-09_8_20_14_all_51_8]
MGEPAIQITDLKKQYQGTIALSSVSFDIKPGEMFGLIGPDGAGKTSLIRILTSLLDPDDGQCRLLGISVNNEPEQVRKVIGYMPQRFSLYPDLTVGENLRFFADLFRVPRQERLKRTEALLQFSRLTPFVKRRAGQLSGGMKQKLALSCALIHTPKVLILDEPTTGVDPVSRREFWGILKTLKEGGVTLLVATPYMDEAEKCDRIALINKGNILAVGTAAEIIERFTGVVYALFGLNLPAIAGWFKKRLHPNQVQILGDRVHVSLFADTTETMDSLCREAENSGHSIRSVEAAEPGLEDTFISLIVEKN